MIITPQIGNNLRIQIVISSRNSQLSFAFTQCDLLMVDYCLKFCTVCDTLHVSALSKSHDCTGGWSRMLRSGFRSVHSSCMNCMPQCISMPVHKIDDFHIGGCMLSSYYKSYFT